MRPLHSWKQRLAHSDAAPPTTLSTFVYITYVQTRRRSRRNVTVKVGSRAEPFPATCPLASDGAYVCTHTQMEVDTFASALKAGERPDCNGLVLVVGWGWGSQDKGYQQLASDVRSLDDSHTLVYEGEYTHCTCATLSRYAKSDA